MSIASRLRKLFPSDQGLKNVYYFDNQQLDGSFVYQVLGAMRHGACEIGEAYETSSRIGSRGLKGWAEEWLLLAQRLEKRAASLQSAGHTVSACDVFLRAHRAYRLSFMAWEPTDDPDKCKLTFEAYDRCFRQFATLTPYCIDPISVPFKDIGLHGWMMTPARDGKKRPTIMFIQGADLVAEDMYHWIGVDAVRRGYNVYSVDIVGDQAARWRYPDTLLDDNTASGVKAQVDFAFGHPSVDPDKVVAVGVSMGGFKSAMMAGWETRLKGVVASPPYMNMGQIGPKHTRKMLWIPFIKRKFRRYVWQYGCKDLYDLHDLWQTFATTPETVKVPFLSLPGEGEFKKILEQARTFHDRIPGQDKVLRFTTVEEGAEGHCQINNLSVQREIVLDWFDEILGRIGAQESAPSLDPTTNPKA